MFQGGDRRERRWAERRRGSSRFRSANSVMQDKRAQDSLAGGSVRCARERSPARGEAFEP